MKKITYLLVLSMAIFVACGPSAEEKAAEQAKKDSIQAVVDLAIQDSIIAAEKATVQVTEQDYDMNQTLKPAKGIKKVVKSTGEVVNKTATKTATKTKEVAKDAATSTEDAFKKAKKAGAKAIGK